MGCPAELAYDYLEAAVLGNEPEVLVGAEATAAIQLAESLRKSGATVALEPPTEPVEPLAEVPHRPPVTSTLKPSAGAPIGPAAASSFITSADLTTGPTIVLSADDTGPPGIDAVERYLTAYNAGNEAHLVRCLSTNAVLSDGTGQVLVEGGEAIGRRMAEVFAHYPDSRVTVLGRQVAGPWVLDHHHTAYAGGASEETVLCFRVDGGLIDRLVLLTIT